MIENQRVLAVIPARGGSKGLPGKNIRDLAGKPLLAWTIEAAKSSKYIDRVVLSSDDEKIMEVARSFGCDVPFKRPAEISTDTTPGVEPLVHALENVPGYDLAVLLQPTSPLRLAHDIDGAVEKLIRADGASCVSVTEAHQSPHLMYRRESDGTYRRAIEGSEKYSRRQDMPKYFILNGAIYVVRVPWFEEKRTYIDESTLFYEMPYERSVDIDSKIDFDWAGLLMDRRLNGSDRI